MPEDKDGRKLPYSFNTLEGDEFEVFQENSDVAERVKFKLRNGTWIQVSRYNHVKK